MKEKINEKPDIKEFIKKKSFTEDHPESFCFEWYRIRFTTGASFSAYNSDVATEFTNCIRNFQHPLVETDAVGNGENNSGYLRMRWHSVKIQYFGRTFRV